MTQNYIYEVTSSDLEVLEGQRIGVALQTNTSST
jgi:hypothetical protein